MSWKSHFVVVCALFLLLFGEACVFNSDCNNRGQCLNGVCNCNPGFVPPVCEPFCQSPANCSYHGQCNNDQCQCDPGWEGDRCQVQGCNLTCSHGGVPNSNTSDCTTCVDCALGWTGQTCSSWDPSVLPELPKALLGVINDHHTFVTQQAKLNPLPGPVGWGVDAFAGTLIKLPVIELSYTDTSKVWGGYRLPVEAVFTPYQVPAGTGQTYVFPGIEDYEGLRTTFGSQNMGRQGIFTEGRADVWDSIWKSNSHDQSLTVTQWEYDVYSVDLPVDPVTRRFEFVLSKFTNRAINMLPPEYNENTAEIFDFFFENYGTSFAKTSKNGGLLEQRSVWTSWLTTQRAESTTPGGAPPSFTLNDIAEQAQNVLYNSTGRSDPGWHHSTVDPDYANASHVIGTQCFGGDPLEACGSAAWIATLPKYPASSQWVTGAMDQLVADPVVSAAVKAAIDTYIAKQKAAWAATSLCPANCGAGGVCDPTSRANKCSCPANIMGRMCSACVYGWTGYTATNACQKPVCAPVTCKNGGSYSCPSPWAWKCTCPAHTTGQRCESCTSGWTGTNCKDFTCGSACKTGKPQDDGSPLCIGPNQCVPVCFGQYKGIDRNGFVCKGYNQVVAPSGSCPNNCASRFYSLQCCAGQCQSRGDQFTSYGCCGTGTYISYQNAANSRQMCCKGWTPLGATTSYSYKCCGYGSILASQTCKWG